GANSQLVSTACQPSAGSMRPPSGRAYLAAVWEPAAVQHHRVMRQRGRSAQRRAPPPGGGSSPVASRGRSSSVTQAWVAAGYERRLVAGPLPADTALLRALRLAAGHLGRGNSLSA